MAVKRRWFLTVEEENVRIMTVFKNGILRYILRFRQIKQRCFAENYVMASLFTLYR